MIKKLLKIIAVFFLICFCIKCCVGFLWYVSPEEDNYVDEMPYYENHDSKRDTFGSNVLTMI